MNNYFINTCTGGVNRQVTGAYRMAYWSVRYYNDNGKISVKRFSVKKLGEEEAERQAREFKCSLHS